MDTLIALRYERRIRPVRIYCSSVTFSPLRFLVEEAYWHQIFSELCNEHVLRMFQDFRKLHLQK